jgi:serine/threonine protein kinase
MKSRPRTILFRGREEEILDVISVRGRQYLALEQLSHRGAFRIFDQHAGINGDYRVLYRLTYSRLTRERIETVRRLTGPTANRNFPYISDCVRQGGDLFVVMSWVWGTNLRELLAQVRQGNCPRPSVTETVRLIRGLAHGLSHYHRRAQVVHGDVSPANIIVTSGTKNLVLVDFGSAWPVEQSATKEMGDGISPPYAAPERMARHALEDFRADQFSLSVIAYEMLTLEIPFDGAGGRAGLPALARCLSESFVPPSRLVAAADRLPEQALTLLDELFGVSLSLHPDGRFATRSEWLGAWDRLHRALQKGDRISGFEHRVMGWLESLIGRIWPGDGQRDSAMS